jgi:hypothetical protein
MTGTAGQAAGGCAATVAREPGAHAWAAVIPPYESAVRRLAADAAGTDYRALCSLAEARAVDDGVVVLEGDLGGRIYAVFPTAIVGCSEEQLVELARDLEAAGRSATGAAAAGETSDPDVYFERHRVGAAIAGGAGGGVVLPGGWVHDELVQAGIEPLVFAVVTGQRASLRSQAG